MTDRQSRTVYVAGPMNGLTGWNQDAFMSAAADLQAHGYETIVPHDLAPREHDGPCPVVYGTGNAGHDSGCYLRACVAAVAMRADLVVTLPGWQASKGARLEVSTARGLRIPVVELRTALVMRRPGMV